MKIASMNWVRAWPKALRESLPAVAIYLTGLAVVAALLMLLPSDYPNSALHFFHR